jgi:hypothetical protein
MILEAIVKLIMVYFVQVSTCWCPEFENNIILLMKLFLIFPWLLTHIQFTCIYNIAIYFFQLILYALTVQDGKIGPNVPLMW